MLIIIQLDPTPFTAFGAVGSFVFVIVVMGGLIFHLVTKQSETYKSQQEQFMNFIGAHTDKTNNAMKDQIDKTNATMKDVANITATSLNKIEGVIAQHTEKLNSFMLMSEVARRIETAKRKGDSLDETMVEKIVRGVVSEGKGR